MKGRVSVVRNLGSLCFFDIRADEHVFNCVVRASNFETGIYRSKRSEIHLGAVIEVLKSGYWLSDKGVKFIDVLDFECSKPLFFPKNYVVNEILDKRIRYTCPILDYVTDVKRYRTIKNRFEIIKFIRTYFSEKDVLEVDVPVLEPTFGGDLAHPFSTVAKYNRKTYYLRNSYQYSLKKLIIAGFPEIFSIGPCFRNEDVDRTHTFEFTMMEYYSTRLDYSSVKALFEDLFRSCYHRFNNTYMYQNFDLRDPIPSYDQARIDQLLRTHDLRTLEELQKRKLLGPIYYLNAIEKTPLGIDPYIFDLYVDYDTQVITGYQQENDYENLVSKTTDPLDEDFCNHLKFGMPRTVGIGLGVDRFVKWILGEASIRDVQTYPKI